MYNKHIESKIISPSDKNIVLAGLFIVSAVGWLYMLYMAWAMENMHLVNMWMPPHANIRPWTGLDFLMLFIMWFTMMIAMMTPTVVPMVMMFATVNKSKKQRHQSYAPTSLFLMGYLLAWGLFSLVAGLIQWPLHTTSTLTPMMNSQSYLLSGSMLILAGAYQFTPLKDVCLNKCRTPLGFIMTAWKDGYLGALKMGFHHGIYCVGCCWALMLILFAVGVMNILWVFLITIFVLLEKILPTSVKMMRMITGLGLVIWGGYWLSLYSTQ